MKKILFVLAFMGCLFLPNLGRAQCMGQMEVENSLNCPIQVTLVLSGAMCSNIVINLSANGGYQCETIPPGCTVTSVQVYDATGGGTAVWNVTGGCISGYGMQTGGDICGLSIISGTGCIGPNNILQILND